MELSLTMPKANYTLKSDKKMRALLLTTLIAFLSVASLSAQTVRDRNNMKIGTIENQGTVRSAPVSSPGILYRVICPYSLFYADKDTNYFVKECHPPLNSVNSLKIVSYQLSAHFFAEKLGRLENLSYLCSVIINVKIFRISDISFRMFGSSEKGGSGV